MGENKNNDEISFNMANIHGFFASANKFFRQKKVLWVMALLLLLFIVIIGTSIRVQNLPLLKDSTTGEYIPIALDPFYFLRVAETIIEKGYLPEIDSMRYIPAKVKFTSEILPQTLVLMYKTANVFGNYSMRFIDVISPVIFFSISLFIFFFLIYFLTKSKITALLSSFFLSIIPAYLYRTMAGFSDHESIGMLVFFSAMLIYTWGLKSLEKKNLLKILLLAFTAGFLTILTSVAWGGVATFLFMIFPLSFLIIWIIKTKDIENKNSLKNYIIFYPSWFFSGILFSLIFESSILSTIGRYVLSTSGLISLFVLGFIFIDYLLINYVGKIKFLAGKENYRILFSFAIIISLGIIFLLFRGENIFSLISNFLEKFLFPFGTGRTGLTIAENAQPYLNQWIGQLGKIFFWLFYFGMVFVGVEFSKGIGKKKNKILFVLFWIIMISGILFSRISPSSIFNGTNFISKLFYLSGLILFLSYVAWLYFNDKIKIKPEIALIASWLLFMIIATRGAVRFFFLIVPFTVFMASFCIVKLFDYWKKSKDDFLKMFFIIILIISVVGLIISGNNFIKMSNSQGKNTGPSANIQWQQAMSWVRENTPEGSIFVHWWDYGHWVTYLGQRPVVTDGGHAVGFWDHLIGRYLLTTPNPETALSFMKSQNVSYLLIDPTDLGKYPAYSRIGSNKKGEDRFSQIPLMVSDPSKIQETANGTVRIYQGGVPVDEDIIYKERNIFLPSGNAIVAGIILEYSKKNNSISFNQPQGVFIYNQKQVNLPLRYVYYDEKIIDFKNGLEAVMRIIPKINQNNQQIQIDNLGVAIYLSPKVSKSLFSQLYLLNDAFENYKTLTLAHSQDSPLISSLKSQGARFGDFVYFNGFRGPIKIWKVDYPSNIISRKEFTRTTGEYAEFDNLTFTK